MLFVQGPPVYVKVKIIEEESTSVFFPNEESVKETIDIYPSVRAESQVVNTAIMNKINYLSGPFQKQVYKPLQFIVEGKVVKGDIQKVQGDIIWIDTDDIVAEIEVAKIEKILWRGHPFEEI